MVLECWVVAYLLLTRPFNFWNPPKKFYPFFQIIALWILKFRRKFYKGAENGNFYFE